jgi:uncharacterized protein
MTASHDSRSFFLGGPAGRLEAILWRPAAPVRHLAPLATVVCHPHPLFGGTMHNKVVYQAAKALDALGLPVLRFNFRGVGLSAGEHDRGNGEMDDVRAAIEFLNREFPHAPILLAGFSFGAWVGLRVGCEEPHVRYLVGMGIPINSTDFSFLQQCEKPKLFLHGSNDQFGDIHKVQSLVGSLSGERKLVIVEDVDHFFFGKLDELNSALQTWLTEQIPRLRQ